MAKNKKKKLDKFTVLSNTKNVKKILSKISAKELEEAFEPVGGIELRLDETLDGPFIGFYNIRTEEALYYTVNEFVEAVRAKFWMHNEPLRSE